MDEDLQSMSREQLLEEVRRLRAGVRAHRDSSGHDLCWHHPALWALLPEREQPVPTVPAWPEFLRGCIRYRQSLDEQLPDAPRMSQPFDARPDVRGDAVVAPLLVNIDVPDLEAALRFYRAAFGLLPGRRLGEAVVELLGGPAPIFLLEKAGGTQAVPDGGATRSFQRHWTPVHLDFVVADIEAAVARALQAGAGLERPATEQAWGRLALLADPFGNGFCLVQFLGRGYDEIANR